MRESFGYGDLIGDLCALRHQYGLLRVRATLELPQDRRVTIIIDRRGTRLVDQAGLVLNVATGRPR